MLFWNKARSMRRSISDQKRFWLDITVKGNIEIWIRKDHISLKVKKRLGNFLWYDFISSPLGCAWCFSMSWWLVNNSCSIKFFPDLFGAQELWLFVGNCRPSSRSRIKWSFPLSLTAVSSFLQDFDGSLFKWPIKIQELWKARLSDSTFAFWQLTSLPPTEISIDLLV